MSAAGELDEKVQSLAVMILAFGGPTALASFQETSRFDRMAAELRYAISCTSGADLAALGGHLLCDSGSALSRRITGIVTLAGTILTGSANEFDGMLKAYSAENLREHFGRRVGIASEVTTASLANGAKSLSSVMKELVSNPADAAPKLLTLVLTSVVVSGGPDGNGGISDMDIPLMGIGAHRSPFTHSIIIGSLLEAALLMLMRIVLATHKNLPSAHDPLWDSMTQQSVGILKAAGQGASIGLAYHLMVDAVVQPGAYHGLPFDMPLEGHQAVMGANAVAEGTAARSFPNMRLVEVTPEVLAAHKKYRSMPMALSAALQEWLTPGEVSVLTKYGCWLHALARAVIPPTTEAQVQFLEVVKLQREPASIHEKAWVSLTEAKTLAGWISRPTSL